MRRCRRWGSCFGVCNGKWTTAHDAACSLDYAYVHCCGSQYNSKRHTVSRTNQLAGQTYTWLWYRTNSVCRVSSEFTLALALALASTPAPALLRLQLACSLSSVAVCAASSCFVSCCFLCTIALSSSFGLYAAILIVLLPLRPPSSRCLPSSWLNMPFPALEMLLLLLLRHLRLSHVVNICGALVAVGAKLTTRPVTGRSCIKHDHDTVKKAAATTSLGAGLPRTIGLGAVTSI